MCDYAHVRVVLGQPVIQHGTGIHPTIYDHCGIAPSCLCSCTGPPHVCPSDTRLWQCCKPIGRWATKSVIITLRSPSARLRYCNGMLIINVTIHVAFLAKNDGIISQSALQANPSSGEPWHHSWSCGNHSWQPPCPTGPNHRAQYTLWPAAATTASLVNWHVCTTHSPSPCGCCSISV